MRTAIIYARVSTIEQGERYGLPVQLRACREYAKQNGLTVVAEVQDERTGENLDRPGLTRARAMVRDGKADAILAMCADRISRELADLLEVDAECKLIFAAEQYDDSPESRMFFQFRGAVAEYERKQIRARTMRGRMERARDGLWLGRAPLGYDYVDDRLIPNEHATHVQRIFAGYSAGLSLREIARQLQSDGVPTWTGKKWWYTSVEAVLKNDTYTGAGSHGSIVVPVPPLVSQELFDRCAARLSSNPNWGRPTGRYLLRGLIWCDCGKKMYGDTSHDRRRYRCRGRHRQVGAEAAEETVFLAVQDALGAALPGLIREHVDGLRRLHGGRENELRTALERARRMEQRAMEDSMSCDDEQRGWYRERIREAAAERRRIAAELGAIESVDSLASLLDLPADELAGLVRQEVAELLTPVERREFIVRSLDRAVFDGAGFVLTVPFYGPEMASYLCPPVPFPPSLLVTKHYPLRRAA